MTKHSTPHHPRSRRLAATTIAVGLVLLAGACSSTTDPDSSPSSTVAATAAPPPKPPPTATAPPTTTPSTVTPATTPTTAPAPTTSAATTTVPPTTAAQSATGRAILTGILDQHRAAGDFVGARIALLDADGGVANVAAGTTAPDSTEAADTETPWGIGSVTKTFVAVVVMQLVDEGRIALDDTIAPWFPTLPGADTITIRQLLQHTSGLSEYIDTATVASDASREWAPEELIAVAEAAGRFGPPGGHHHYSNVNYVMLGEIIAGVTGHSWSDEVAARISEPLGMTSTGVLADGEVTGYSNVGGAFVASVDKHPSIGGAAGAMKSTTHDLLTFVTALADGSLLSPASQAAMLTMVEGDDLSQFGIVHEYGLGIERYSNAEISIIGHMGSGNVNSAFIGYDPATGTAVAVMMNTDTPGPQAFMAIEALMAAAAG